MVSTGNASYCLLPARAGFTSLRFFYESDPELKRCINQIQKGVFSPEEPALFSDLVNILLNHDNYLLCKDYRSYVDCQVGGGGTWCYEDGTGTGVDISILDPMFSLGTCVRAFYPTDGVESPSPAQHQRFW